jgi:hypothetical protein
VTRPLALLTVAVALAVLAAGAPPVALRVETAAIRSEGEGTVMSVTVQVAPEDRSRLGRDVWVQCELLRGGRRVQRLARALDLDESGQAGLEVAWPAGDFELRVTIEGAGDRAAGVWVGPLSVPAMGPGAPRAAAPAPLTAAAVATLPPAASTAPEPAAPPAASHPEVAPAGEIVTERTAEPSAAEPAPVAAATAAAPEPTATPPAMVPTPVTAAAAVPTAEPPSPSQSVVAKEAETVPEPAAEPPVAESTPVVAASASAEPAEPQPPPEPGATAPAAVVPDPAVEPPPMTEPAAQPPAEVRTSPAAEPAPAPVPPAPAAAAGVTGAAWAAANPGMADVTVFVTERNRPILGLDASAFTLRVGGSGATVAAVGNVASAPLNLALVADVATDAAELANEIARQLGRFSLRARNGGDLMVMTTAEPRPVWGAGADAITRWADEAAAGRPDDLARLVAAAAQAAAGRRGRSVLVVVTDGSDACGKAAWKDAADAAEAAGVPIFTIGLRDNGFDDQARAGLSRIADATGGRSYFLGSAGMAGMTLDYLGELIDASYALAYRQAAASGGPRELKVEAVNRDWQVHHPRRVP